MLIHSIFHTLFIAYLRLNLSSKVLDKASFSIVMQDKFNLI